MEQNREPRNKLTHLWSINLWQQRKRIFSGEKTISSASGAGKFGQSHANQWRLEHTLTPYKNVSSKWFKDSAQGSSVHRILQARILEWAAIPFSRGTLWPRDWTQVFCTVGRFFTIWATREALNIRHDTIKRLEENIGKIFSDIKCTNVF